MGILKFIGFIYSFREARSAINLVDLPGFSLVKSLQIHFGFCFVSITGPELVNYRSCFSILGLFYCVTFVGLGGFG